MNEKQKQINRIAKCQSRRIYSPSKCNYCGDRFICQTTRFGIKDVKGVPNWVFCVKNNAQGRDFIKILKASINKDLFSVRVRGRAKNRRDKGGCQSYQPQKMADYFVVYLNLTALSKDFLLAKIDDGKNTLKATRIVNERIVPLYGGYWPKSY